MKISPRVRIRLLWAGVLVASAGAAAWFYRDELFDKEAILAFGQGIPVAVFLAAFLLLPLVGFPITLLLVLAGMRFGFAGGMAVAAGGMFFHNAAAFWATHSWFRDRLRRRIERYEYRIPSIDAKHQAWFTALFAAIHGPPYAAKLYLLALTDVSFRIYLWVGAPIYIIFSVIPVGAGSAATNFDAKLVYLLVGVSVALLAAGAFLKKRYAKSS